LYPVVSKEKILMVSQSNFLKISVVVFVVLMLALAGMGSVRAGVPAQATASASETATVTGGATANATASGTAAAATAIPTLGGDEPYPPCPAAIVVTAAATTAGTEATASAGATAAATAASTAAATTEAAAATQAAGATAVASQVATTAATQAATAAQAAATPSTQMGPFKTVNGCTLTATLAGVNEVPKPGDPDGTGTATLTITRPETGPGEICFQIETTNLTLPAAAAHIHAGPAGIAGPVVVPLGAPDASGKSSGCVSGVDRSLIKTLLLYPSDYYVNVHTPDFPDGAERGQLGATAQ